MGPPENKKANKFSLSGCFLVILAVILLATVQHHRARPRAAHVSQSQAGLRAPLTHFLTGFQKRPVQVFYHFPPGRFLLRSKNFKFLREISPEKTLFFVACSMKSKSRKGSISKSFKVVSDSLQPSVGLRLRLKTLAQTFKLCFS